MDDAEVVEVGEGLGELAAPLHRLSRRKGALGIDPAFEAPAGDVLDDHVGLAVALADIETALEVGVHQGLGEMRLPPPAGGQDRDWRGRVRGGTG